MVVLYGFVFFFFWGFVVGGDVVCFFWGVVFWGGDGGLVGYMVFVILMDGFFWVGKFVVGYFGSVNCWFWRGILMGFWYWILDGDIFGGDGVVFLVGLFIGEFFVEDGLGLVN